MVEKSDLSIILGLLEKLITLEGLIETKIKQVNDVNKRKEIQELVKNRDSDKFRKLLFGDK